MISIAIIALDRQPTSLEPVSAGVRVGRNCYRTHATASVARLAFPFVSPAVNPPNAVLNYLYAVLESDASLAANELGLDPGLGVLHRDTPNRNSLACDLMEPVRPLVYAYLFDWLVPGPLRREWLFEQPNGNCRLMGPFARELAETAIVWRKAVAPYTEEAARILWHGGHVRVPVLYSPGIRRGSLIPHPRHWLKLAELTGYQR